MGVRARRNVYRLPSHLPRSSTLRVPASGASSSSTTSSLCGLRAYGLALGSRVCDLVSLLCFDLLFIRYLYAPSREVSGPVVRRACLLRHHKLIQAHTTHVQRAVDFVEAAAKWPVPLPVLVPRFLRVATGTCVAEGARSQQPLPPWPVPMPRPRAV